MTAQEILNTFTDRQSEAFYNVINDICSNCAICENGTYCNELDSVTTPDSTCKEFERKGE